MKNNKENISTSNNTLNRKRVHWGEDSINNDEKPNIKKRRKSSLEERDKFLEQRYIQDMKLGHYERLKEGWTRLANKTKKVLHAKAKYGEDSPEVLHAIKKGTSKLASINKFSLFTWAAANSDIKAMKLIKETTTDYYFKLNVYYEKYLAFKMFLTEQRANEGLGIYNRHDCIEGFKVFLTVTVEPLIDIMMMPHRSTPNMKRDFLVALEQLIREGAIENPGIDALEGYKTKLEPNQGNASDKICYRAGVLKSSEGSKVILKEVPDSSRDTKLGRSWIEYVQTSKVNDSKSSGKA
ncbi:hypothetical protein NF27_JF00520 [Candidatus Jidaibacter acanthamoeba]|uniref:Uncharacterized protein n=1 Tax=Candidatus Jidaibacter acanthamoebae TaxID=86105 RepID=A0A0C1QF48_9RICK|nr:hypothetical protein [Candidatus Jidaibacter acanthamoeba]KIE04174.1 hypothetical protein NF27_JF00520 [Candidatus Jidaibacter acanthamoeba]